MKMTPQELRDHLAVAHPGIGLATGPTGMYPDGRPHMHLDLAHRDQHGEYPEHPTNRHAHALADLDEMHTYSITPAEGAPFEVQASHAVVAMRMAYARIGHGAVYTIRRTDAGPALPFGHLAADGRIQW